MNVKFIIDTNDNNLNDLLKNYKDNINSIKINYNFKNNLYNYIKIKTNNYIIYIFN